MTDRTGKYFGSRCLLSSIALTITLCFLTACSSHDGNSVVPLTPAQIAERAQPATVAVVAQYDATVNVTQLLPDVDRLVAAVREQANGSESKKELLEKLFNIYLSHPEDYLREGDPLSRNKSIVSLGTGFIITPDGYILTNAHVVQPDEDDLKEAVVKSIGELVDDDVDAIQKAVNELLPGETIGDTAVEALKNKLAKVYLTKASFQFNKQISVIMPPSDSGDKENLEPIHCAVAKVGEPVPGKDIAVLKVEGNDLPTLPLATTLANGSANPGDELIVYGYPGEVAFYSTFTLRSRMQPSLTLGHVSGIKEMSDGWQVIQTDATVNHGNSGGPALNQYGQVVGLATFGLPNSQGLNFAISIDLAREFLNQLNVQPRESTFTRTYDRALAEYDRPGHGSSLQLFRELRESHPNLGVLTNYVRQLSPEQAEFNSSSANSAGSNSNMQASHTGPDPEPHRNVPVFLFLGIGGLLLAIIVIVVLSSRR